LKTKPRPRSRENPSDQKVKKRWRHHHGPTHKQGGVGRSKDKGDIVSGKGWKNVGTLRAQRGKQKKKNVGEDKKKK